MKMLKALFCSICVFLSAALSAGNLCASDYFSNALRVYSEGRFFEASIEFERAVYYESDIKRVAVYKYYKSLCYKRLVDYGKALEVLNSINPDDLSDSLTLFIRYEQILCSFLNNDLNQAFNDIDEIYLRFKDTLRVLEIVPLNILCLNAVRQYDNALILWNYYIENYPLQDSAKNVLKEEIGKLYDKRNIPRYYSPKKAANLSRFVPGSGQVYCGAVFEGSLSLLINASLLWYTYCEFHSKYYFTGNFIGLGFFGRFYRGGIRRANLLAQRKNTQGMREFNAENSSLMMKVLDAKILDEPGYSPDFNLP